MPSYTLAAYGPPPTTRSNRLPGHVCDSTGVSPARGAWRVGRTVLTRALPARGRRGRDAGRERARAAYRVGMTSSARDRLRGGLLGLLVGDALGVPYEFHPARAIPPLESIEMTPPPGFRRAHASVPPGTWSDDGAQALVLLRRLLDDGRLDVDRFAAGLVAWQDQGWYAVDGRVFDIGVQTHAALRAVRSGVPALEAGPARERANGNGSLMRVLPMALWHNGTDGELVRDAIDQSRVTHGHLRAQVCCAVYCLWARRLLSGMPPAPAWRDAIAAADLLWPKWSPKHAELHDVILPVESAAAEPSRITGDGYVVSSLRAAVHLVARGEPVDYEWVVRSAIALGDDTDTTACIAGGVAGLVVGERGIPERWLAALREREETVEPLLEALCARHGA